MDFVVDRSLDVLVGQINEAAPLRSKASDGSIGNAAHAATVSAHNPEDTADSSDGNDPDSQVDARDITHDPRYPGSDMGRVTEAIRVSRDRRVRLVIFNRHIFSSYATATRPAWTWGPYSGDNPHDKHAHVETNDVHNDETQKWAIGVNMAWEPTPHEQVNLILNGSTDKGFVTGREARDAEAGSVTIAGGVNLRVVVDKLNQLVAAAVADEARDKAVLAAVTALANAGGVEAAPIVTAIEAVKTEMLGRFSGLVAENAGLRAQLAALPDAVADEQADRMRG